MRGGVAFDTIVAADMLYDADVAELSRPEWATSLRGRWQRGSIRLVVCDPDEDVVKTFWMRSTPRQTSRRLALTTLTSSRSAKEMVRPGVVNGVRARDIFDGSPGRRGCTNMVLGTLGVRDAAYAVAYTRPRYCNYNI